MPLSLERQEAMYDEKLTEISSAIQAAKADKGERFTVKALERQRKQIEKKIEKMRAAFKKTILSRSKNSGVIFFLWTKHITTRTSPFSPR